MFRTIALSVLGVGIAAVAIILLIASTRPDTFRVKRSLAIKAPPEKIFAYINDLRRWEAWSPYEKLDPAMKRTYGDRTAGTGARYDWDGNGNVGKGRIEITDATPPSRIALSLEMVRPFACHNAVEFTLEPDGDATNVTWAMEGPSHFLSKVVSVFINMDRMVGGQFEEGLANLKKVAEEPAPKPAVASTTVHAAR